MQHPRRLFVCLLSVFVAIPTAYGLAFGGAAPTIIGSAEIEDEKSPQTTSGPHFAQMWKRSNGDMPDSFCGFIDGTFSRSIKCSSTATCVILTTGGLGFQACCATPSACYARTSCVDYNSYQTACGESCEANPYIAKCSNSETPYCLSRTLWDDPVLDTVKRYQCGTQTADLDLYLTADDDTRTAAMETFRMGIAERGTSAVPSDIDPVTVEVEVTVVSTREQTILQSGSPETAAIPSGAQWEPTSPPASGSPQGNPVPSGTPISPEPTASPSSGKGAQIGPIVGGSIGGFFLLLIIAFYLRRHFKKRNNRNDISTVPESTTAQIRPPGGRQSAFGVPTHNSVYESPASPPPGYERPGQYMSHSEAYEYTAQPGPKTAPSTVYEYSSSSAPRAPPSTVYEFPAQSGRSESHEYPVGPAVAHSRSRPY